MQRIGVSGVLRIIPAPLCRLLPYIHRAFLRMVNMAYIKRPKIAASMKRRGASPRVKSARADVTFVPPKQLKILLSSDAPDAAPGLRDMASRRNPRRPVASR